MARKQTDWLQLGAGKSYFHRVHRPLQCLVFISPLLLIYQIGSAVHPWLPSNDAAAGNGHVTAFLLMLHFFSWFGAVGNVLPVFAVIAILLSWHLARKDPWDFDPKLYSGMAAESIVWGIPFMVIGSAVTRHAAQAAATGGGGLGGTGGAIEFLPWQTQVVISVGAGIYEELLFRLIAIILLSIILVDVLELKPGVAIPLIILISALLFSAYHLLGNEPFSLGIFIFRAALGVYFAGIYIYRGFGIVVGAHTVYDLLWVGLNYRR